MQDHLTEASWTTSLTEDIAARRPPDYSPLPLTSPTPRRRADQRRLGHDAVLSISKPGNRRAGQDRASSFLIGSFHCRGTDGLIQGVSCGHRLLVDAEDKYRLAEDVQRTSQQDQTSTGPMGARTPTSASPTGRGWSRKRQPRSAVRHKSLEGRSSSFVGDVDYRAEDSSVHRPVMHRQGDERTEHRKTITTSSRSYAGEGPDAERMPSLLSRRLYSVRHHSDAVGRATLPTASVRVDNRENVGSECLMTGRLRLAAFNGWRLGALPRSSARPDDHLRHARRTSILPMARC